MRRLARTVALLPRLALALAAALLPRLALATTCNVNAAPAASFGTYSPVAAAPLDVLLGSVAYECKGISANDFALVTLGASAGGSNNPRTMRGPGGALLAYNVYLDAARTQVFGDGTNGTSAFTQINGGSRTLPLFGRIPAGQAAAAGTYTDQLTLTFNF